MVYSRPHLPEAVAKPRTERKLSPPPSGGQTRPQPETSPKGPLPALLKILAAFQTILGTILLLLFDLGIRNKFRMK
jgi:hypothetical protein